MIKICCEKQRAQILFHYFLNQTAKFAPVEEKLDFERKTTYQLTNQAEVIIIVSDENKNAPWITNTRLSLTLSKDT